MGMSKAYKSSGAVFEQVSMRYQPQLLERLRAVGGKDIVVVQGTYDHMEKLLDTIRVPYTLIGSEDVAGHNGGRVMFVNCKAYDTGAPVAAVKGFVEAGGRLVTTDWALGLTAKAFPHRLAKVGQTPDDVIEIQCHSDLARRFVGMNYAQCSPKWWLEGSSHVYTIKDGVTPIILSEEMKEKYGSPYVAVGFPAGRGEVFHFISHLELQRTHLRSKADKGSLDDYLAKMKIERTDEMEDAHVAELEAAFSTLNTLAYLCLPTPLLNQGMNSVTMDVHAADPSKTMKSVKLA